MALVFHESAFHVTYDAETADKLVEKMDLIIKIVDLIEQYGLTIQDTAEKLSVSKLTVEDVLKSKIEKFTKDELVDMVKQLETV